MIYGIGTDIAQVKRFQKWVSNPSMLSRFFNENEMFSGNINEKNDEKDISFCNDRHGCRIL